MAVSRSFLSCDSFNCHFQYSLALANMSDAAILLTQRFAERSIDLCDQILSGQVHPSIVRRCIARLSHAYVCQDLSDGHSGLLRLKRQDLA